MSEKLNEIRKYISRDTVYRQLKEMEYLSRVPIEYYELAL